MDLLSQNVRFATAHAYPLLKWADIRALSHRRNGVVIWIAGNEIGNDRLGNVHW